jgi:hypothetical protein
VIDELARIADDFEKGRLTQVEAIREIRRLRDDLSETAASYVLDDADRALRR